MGENSSETIVSQEVFAYLAVFVFGADSFVWWSFNLLEKLHFTTSKVIVELKDFVLQTHIFGRFSCFWYGPKVSNHTYRCRLRSIFLLCRWKQTKVTLNNQKRAERYAITSWIYTARIVLLQFWIIIILYVILWFNK